MNIDEIIECALAEDIGDGDHTTLATIPAGVNGRAKLIVKESGILCGTEVASAVFGKIDPCLVIEVYLRDGAVIHPGDIAFEVSGQITSILQSERLVLNFMQRMSGIATATNRAVERIRGFNTKLLDTRKTTPLMRSLEKYSVRTGGGENHRAGLYDMVMIKDNHVDFSGGIKQAIEAVRDYLEHTGKKLKIEIEVRNMQELEEVLEHGGVDRIMLDNFPPDLLRRAVEKINHRFETEASGGITFESLPVYAATGVDYISMGALTHQIRSLDLSLKAVH